MKNLLMIATIVLSIVFDLIVVTQVSSWKLGLLLIALSLLQMAASMIYIALAAIDYYYEGVVGDAEY